MATGWRHVYTWSRRGALGVPGFQTVAHAEELAGERLRALERRVAGLRPPETVPARPALFVHPAPGDPGRTVLTRATLTGRSADGRPGGFRAESLVVPDGWLEDAGWDLEAAFAAVDWRDAPDGAGGAAGDGDGPDLLPAEELPELPPPGGTATDAKLARLDRLLPDPELRAALLETLIWQAEDGGRDEPVFLVPAPETPPEELETLILLLPLALRPEERVRGVDFGQGRPGERRCLRLGTLATPGSLERPDLLGVPDELLEEARRASGLVVDLGGRIPPPRPGDARIRERARAVSRSLSEGAAGGPGRSEEATMADDRHERLEPDADGAPSFDPDPLAERAAAWRLRDDSEARAGALLERLRAEHDRMLEPLARLVEGERERFRSEVEGLKRELGEIVEEARADLAREADRGRQRLQGEIERRKEVLRGSLDTRIEELDRYQEELLRRLSEEEVRAERRLREAAGLAPTERKRGAERAPVGAPAPSGGAWRSAAASRPGLRERLRRWPAGARWAALGAVLALLVAAGWYLVPRGGEGEATNGGAAPGDARTADGGAPAASDPRAVAVERLRSGALAAAVLRSAAGSPATAVRDRAAAAHLAILLGADGLGETTSCALLQQVLTDRRVAAGQGPIAVDGACGPGTQGVLAEAAAAVGCGGGGAWESQGACVVGRTFAGGDPPCETTWPLRRSCSWSAAEAERALATVRRLPAELRAPLDLGRDPGLASALAGRRLSDSEAEALVPLAWAAAEEEAGRPVARVPEPGTLDARRLAAALAYLDDVDERGGAAP